MRSRPFYSLILIAAACLSRGAHADPQADALLESAFTTISQAKSASGDLEMKLTMDKKKPITFTGHFECLKPNYLRCEAWIHDGSQELSGNDPAIQHLLNVSDGTNYWAADESHPATIVERPVTADGREFGTISHLLWSSFYSSSRTPDIREMLSHVSTTGVTSETWQGDTYRVVTGLNNDAESKPSVKIYVAADNTIRRILLTGDNTSGEFTITNAHINDDVQVSDFVFRLPSYATLVKQSVDAKAFALLQNVEDSFAGVDAFTATIKTTTTSAAQPELESVETSQTKVKALRPIYVNLVTTNTNAASKNKQPIVLACDGTSVWRISYYDDPRYQKATSDSMAGMFDVDVNTDPVHGFFKSCWIESIEENGKTQLFDKGSQTWNGVTYHVIKLKRTSNIDGHSNAQNNALYIGDDNIIRRVITESTADDGFHSTTDSSIVDLDRHATLTPADFAYTPPAGYKEVP